MLSDFLEIGSEFWIEQDPTCLLSERDGLFVLSGRTAIDIILQDILSNRSTKNVYMPAYCCDSMIYPFHKRGIKVDLYDISFDGELHYNIDKEKKADIFFVNNYFGYENTISLNIIRHFKENGSIIIYDRTHSFLMDNDCVEADYSFASIRKWMGVVDGAVVEGVENIESVILRNCPFFSTKEKAMKDKYRYFNGDSTVVKDDFLNGFIYFSYCLQNDYMDYEMDNLSYSIYKSADRAFIKEQRRDNAKYLHEHLNLQFIGEPSDFFSPLFVPVFFETLAQRNKVRKTLIGDQIYCPVHWPKNSLIKPYMKVNTIFDTELSLICDQRYTIEHMTRIVDKIKSIL